MEEHPPELDALLALIDARLEPERAPAVRDFACAYVRRLSGDAQGGPPATEALFHEIVGIFELACARDGAPAAVRAFNPSVTEDGYETPGSVVETNTEDLPFLVDSVTAELQARGLGIRRVRHPIVGTERAANGQIERIAHPRRSSTSESVMHFDLDRRLDPEELADVEDAVRVVLGEVRRVVRDFPAMRQRLAGMIEIARGGQARYDADEIEETVAFLEWLARDAFILLGYREYELADGHIRAVPTSGLGLLADVSRSAYAQPVAVASLPAELQAALAEGSQLVITKTNASSPVHKRARMDDVAVRRVAADGSTAGWARLLGLFTTKAYTQPASETPVLAAKLRAILAAEDLIEGSHDYKAAVSLFASLPKDELFAASTEDLRRAVVGLLSLEGDAVRVMGRRHGEGRSVSLLIALPHARYGVGMRERLRDLAARRFGTPSVAVHEVFGEGDRVLVHLTVHSARGDLPYVPFRELEREVVALTRTWEDAVRETLVARHGEQRGRKLAARWLPRLPEAYKAAANAETAVHDVGCLERLAVGGESFVVSLHADPGGARTRVVFATTGGKVELARIMPVLQDLGLRVIDEIPTRVGEGETWVQAFGVLGPDDRPLDLEASGVRAADCIAAVWRGQSESDSLNRLVLTAGLDWPRVTLLRAYRRYRQRIGSRYTESFQNDVLAANPQVTAKLMRLLEARFDPANQRDEAAEEALRTEILEDLDAIASLDHDRILRNQLGLIEATLRTNAYRPGRGPIAIKLRGADVRDLRVLAGDGRRPFARRGDRPRRDPLVGPHGLPHRGVRPHARADD